MATLGGVTFINDSQATTPPATLAALDAFEGRLALIAGGRPKVHDFSEVTDAVAARRVSLILIGEAAEEIAAAARKSGVSEITLCGQLARSRLACLSRGRFPKE